MKIALIEKTLDWENIPANLSAFKNVLHRVDALCQMVVLPEMFSTGFSMHPERFSSSELNSVPEWMLKMASIFNILVCGSSIAKERAGYFNRFYFAFPDGSLQWYDKRHLFRMGEENNAYLPGKKRVVVQYDGWRILPQVCYDIRFPVWNRNLDDYDLAIYVANWPSARKEVWTTLLKARAIENQCYVVGVNRIGTDPNVSYHGDSVVFSPKGEKLSIKMDAGNEIITADLSLEELIAFREKFPVWKDRDAFRLEG